MTSSPLPTVYVPTQVFLRDPKYALTYIDERKRAFADEHRVFSQYAMSKSQAETFHALFALLLTQADFMNRNLQQLYILLEDDMMNLVINILQTTQCQHFYLNNPCPAYILTLDVLQEYTATLMNIEIVYNAMVKWRQSAEGTRVRRRLKRAMEGMRESWSQCLGLRPPINPRDDLFLEAGWLQQQRSHDHGNSPQNRYLTPTLSPSRSPSPLRCSFSSERTLVECMPSPSSEKLSSSDTESWTIRPITPPISNSSRSSPSKRKRKYSESCPPSPSSQKPSSKRPHPIHCPPSKYHHPQEILVEFPSDDFSSDREDEDACASMLLPSSPTPSSTATLVENTPTHVRLPDPSWRDTSPCRDNIGSWIWRLMTGWM
ncbi:hypothetical protein C8Q75DRAFT_809337 [Abortiporus biennis]|nr:hypothetical protein C8Q75DRAFT_809337 [Abortiporus biennis]